MSIIFALLPILLFAVIGAVYYTSAKNAQKAPLPYEKRNCTPTYDKHGNVSARDHQITPQAVKMANAKNIRERMVAVHNFYRKQSQVQSDVVLERTEEQQNIFENYFHVLNYRTTTCNPILRAMATLFYHLFLGCFIGGILGVIFGFVDLDDDNPFGLILGVALLLGAIVCIVLKSRYQKEFESSIKSFIAPKNLISDEEYENMVAQKIASLNLYTLSLDKLGIDNSQVEEVRPIILRDKTFIDTSMKVYNRNDNTLHSSTQYVTVIYFTNDQLFVYKVRFDMCCNLQTEWTSELFYQDICDISTRTETNIIIIDGEPAAKEAAPQGSRSAAGGGVKVAPKKSEPIKLEYSTVSFEIIASNSSIGFEMVGSDENLASIRGMQQKIRDKKNS